MTQKLSLRSLVVIVALAGLSISAASATTISGSLTADNASSLTSAPTTPCSER